MRGDGGVGLSPNGHIAATGFHNKVEGVFLVMHIGFMGVYSGNINKVGFLVHLGGFLVHFGGFFGICWGVYLVQNGFFFGTSWGASRGTGTGWSNL